MNPVLDFLTEKQAATQMSLPFAGGGIGDAVRRHGAQLPEMFAKGLAGAGATAAVGAAVAGTGIAARALFQAATKGRDFRKMIEFNPDLAAEHEKDPKQFNQLFTSLRSVNPSFSSDPVIAGSYMRRMVGSPAAGGVLGDAIMLRSKQQPSFGEALQRTTEGGLSVKGK